MKWFKNRAARSPQQLTARVIKFSGEQDGAAEHDLKVRFIELFRHEPTVERAYLARADYGDATGIHVALSVKSSVGEDKSLNPKVAGIFGAMFGSHEHLDLLFIREDQEEELRLVCAPFYHQ